MAGFDLPIPGRFWVPANMVVTSLNLYEYSQFNNREMGLLLTKESDAQAFDEAIEEAEFIIQTARPIRVNKPLMKELSRIRKIEPIS